MVKWQPFVNLGRDLDKYGLMKFNVQGMNVSFMSVHMPDGAVTTVDILRTQEYFVPMVSYEELWSKSI